MSACVIYCTAAGFQGLLLFNVNGPVYSMIPSTISNNEVKKGGVPA